jgi:hypothetical protein
VSFLAKSKSELYLRRSQRNRKSYGWAKSLGVAWCKVGIANLGQSQPLEVVANNPKFTLWVVCDYPKHLFRKVPTNGKFIKKLKQSLYNIVRKFFQRSN